VADAGPVVGHVIGIERLLTGPQGFGHVLQVDPDPGPRREAAAHRVNQDISRLEMGRRLRMAHLPSAEPRQHRVLVSRSADFDEGVHRGPTSRRLDARRLARLLSVVGRPRCVPEPFGLLSSG